MQLKLVVQVHNYAKRKRKLSIITRTNMCHSKANKCSKYIIYVRENRREMKKIYKKTKQKTHTRNTENYQFCSYRLSIHK
jgi:hypothetical protein